MSALGHKRTCRRQILCPVTPKADISRPPRMFAEASLRLELMQQDGVAFAVQAHRHSTDRTVDDITLEGDTLALEVGHEAIEVLDLERDCAAGGVAGLFLGEVGKSQAARRQASRIPPTSCPLGSRPSQT
jgi:hypothetical protein